MALTRRQDSIVNPIVPHRIIAGAFGMAAFSVSVLCGLYVQNPAPTILWRALLALLTCYCLGMVVGWICEYVVREHLARYKEERPVPTLTGDIAHANAGARTGKKK